MFSALPVAAPPKSIAAPKKKVERTQSHKPRPTPPIADDNLPMASSLDNPLIQNNMLGARDATVQLLAQTSVQCTPSSAFMILSSDFHLPSVHMQPAAELNVNG